MAVLFNDLHSSAHWLTRTRAPAGAGAACQRLGHRIGESANRRVSESARQRVGESGESSNQPSMMSSIGET